MKRCASFSQAPQEEFSLSTRDVSGTLCFLSQVEWTPRGPDYKEGPISLQWLKFRLFFISQDEGTSKSPVETVEKAVGVRLIWTGGLKSICPLERHAEFNDS